MSIYLRSRTSFNIYSKIHGLVSIIHESLERLIPQDVRLRKYVNQSLGWFGGDFEDLGEVIKVRYQINEVPFEILLRKQSSDANVFIQCILNKEYDIVSSLVKSLPNQPLRIIDGGANIGAATIYFNCVLNQMCEIICVEPLDSNADNLAAIVSANNYDNVRILRKGLWNKNAHLKKADQLRDGLDWSFSLAETDKAEESIVDVTTIEEIMTTNRWSGIDLLKLDIEGAEAVIFEDESCLQTFLPKTKIITIEVHEEFISVNQITVKLQSFGFATFRTGEHVVGVNLNTTKID